MNKQILELWKQAGGHYNSGDQHNWPSYTIDNPENFVKLIVRECMTKVSEELDDSYSEDGKEILNERVLEHFGVEE